MQWAWAPVPFLVLGFFAWLMLSCRHMMRISHQTAKEVVYLCAACGKTKKVVLECVHEWVEKERTVVVPASTKFGEINTPPHQLESVLEHMRRTAQGSRSILYECAKCHEHEQRELAGN